MKRKKLPTFSSLELKLDEAFRQFIKRRDYPDGVGICISCGCFAQLQCGHFVKRQHRAVRWNVQNAHGQCVRCNKWLHGNEGSYCLALVRKYGEPAIAELLEMKHRTVKHTREDLAAMIEFFR